MASVRLKLSSKMFVNFKVLIISCVLSVCIGSQPEFKVLNSKAFKIAIPVDEGYKVVSFNGNVNGKFEIFGNAIKIDENVVYVSDENLNLKKNDVINYGITSGNMEGYQFQNGSYQFNGDFSSKLHRKKRSEEETISSSSEENLTESRFGGGHHHHHRGHNFGHGPNFGHGSNFGRHPPPYNYNPNFNFFPHGPPPHHGGQFPGGNFPSGFPGGKYYHHDGHKHNNRPCNGHDSWPGHNNLQDFTTERARTSTGRTETTTEAPPLIDIRFAD